MDYENDIFRKILTVYLEVQWKQFCELAITATYLRFRYCSPQINFFGCALNGAPGKTITLG